MTAQTVWDGSEVSLQHPVQGLWDSLTLSSKYCHRHAPAALSVSAQCESATERGGMRGTAVRCMVCAVQRLSVIASDVVLLSAVWFATRKQRGSERLAVRLLVAANAGLLLVDHIHFQYNGMLLGAADGLLCLHEYWLP